MCGAKKWKKTGAAERKWERKKGGIQRKTKKTEEEGLYRKKKQKQNLSSHTTPMCVWGHKHCTIAFMYFGDSAHISHPTMFLPINVLSRPVANYSPPPLFFIFCIFPLPPVFSQLSHLCRTGPILT